MELSKREQLFAALAPAFIGMRMFDGSRNDEIWRECWKLVDQAMYHSANSESPEQIAKRWLKKGFVILDTETTGLGADAEIVEISVIAADGTVLLNTLVKPPVAIPAAATAIHGITDEMVADAPSWMEILPTVIDLTSKGWVAYNASFDFRMLQQAGGRLAKDSEDIRYPECVMQLYAEHNGEWDPRRRKYKWKRLVEAAKSLDVDVGEGVAHRALYDCRMTLGVIQAIAGGAAE